jgi:hypothetical protein
MLCKKKKNSGTVQQHSGCVFPRKRNVAGSCRRNIVNTRENWKLELLALKRFVRLSSCRSHPLLLKLTLHVCKPILFGEFVANAGPLAVATRTQPTARAASATSLETEENAFEMERKTTLVRLQ